jgi:hypothetical protein
MFVIDAIADAAKSVFGIIDKFVPDKDLAAQLKHQTEMELLKADTELQKGQIEVNKEEAKSDSVFVAGWRPSVGWICSLTLFYNFILYNLLQWLIAFNKSAITAPPPISAELLYPLLFGMLGLGAYRSFDKYKGGK